MNSRIIEQSVVISGAQPDELYAVFMDQEKHAKLVNSNAFIENKTGGKFDIYDGFITGKNIELIPGKKIIQDWRGEDECWPRDHFSRLTIILEKVEEGAKINLKQEFVPEDCYDSFFEGWYEYYWKPLQEMFKK